MNKENLNLFKELYKYIQRQLGFKHPAKLFLKSDLENAENSLCKTGFYDPEKLEITIFTTQRHIKDQLRTFAHELFHHKQNLDGKMDNNAQYEDRRALFSKR